MRLSEDPELAGEEVGGAPAVLLVGGSIKREATEMDPPAPLAPGGAATPPLAASSDVAGSSMELWQGGASLQPGARTCRIYTTALF